MESTSAALPAIESNRPSRARLLRLQFSLASLFVALTALCIAAGVWWNWPFEVEVHHDPYGPGERITFGVEQVNEGWCSYPKDLRVVREVRTVFRWGTNGVVQHGLTRYFDEDDKLLGEDRFFRGLRHGPSKRYFLNGSLRTNGIYYHGKKEGKWTDHGRYAPSTGGHVTREYSWRLDRAHDKWRWLDPNGMVKKSLKFRDGELIEVDSKPAFDALFLQLRSQQVTDTNVAELLLQARQLGTVNQTQTPKAPAFRLYVGRYPVLVKWEPEDFRKELPLGGLPWESLGNYYHVELPLHAAFALLLSPHRLACIYDDGHLWVVSIKSAAEKIGVTFPRTPTAE